MSRCTKKNCPMVGASADCDLKDCPYRTEADQNKDTIYREDAIKAVLGITMYEHRVPIDTVIYNIKSLPSADIPKVIDQAEQG